MLAKQILKTVTNVPMRESKIWKFKKNHRVFWTSLTYSGNWQKYEVFKKQVQNFKTFRPILLPQINHVSLQKKTDVEDLLKFVNLSNKERQFYINALNNCDARDTAVFARSNADLE